MAPHSPIPGLPLAYESRAPPQPEALSRPYTHLLASSGSETTEVNKRATATAATGGGRFAPHLPGRPHSLPVPLPRTTFSGLPTVVFAVLLVMLIAVSSAMYEYDARDQSMADVVKTAYFERDVYIASGLMMDKRQMGAGVPVSADPPSSSTSASASTVAPSATSSAAKPAKSTFHDDDAENVRDPSAVKPDNGENKQAPDADPSDDGQSGSAAAAAPTARKRHWNSRGPRHGLGRRAFWY